MLHLLKSSMEGELVVSGQHRNRFLGDDGPVIDFLVDEVHGDTRDGDTVRKGIGHRIRTGKRREECRMHVDDRVAEPSDGRRSEDPHEARKHETSRSMAFGCVAERLREGRPVAVIAPQDDLGRDPGGARSSECADVGVICDHHRDVTVEIPASRTVDECLEVRATPRGEDGDGEGIWHWRRF